MEGQIGMWFWSVSRVSILHLKKSSAADLFAFKTVARLQLLDPPA